MAVTASSFLRIFEATDIDDIMGIGQREREWRDGRTKRLQTPHSGDPGESWAGPRGQVEPEVDMPQVTDWSDPRTPNLGDHEDYDPFEQQ